MRGLTRRLRLSRGLWAAPNMTRVSLGVGGSQRGLFDYVHERKKLDNQLDLERNTQIDDPNVIFESVYKNLKEQANGSDLRFPKEVTWLCGAPGAGKGTHSATISKERGYVSSEPILMSSLLVSKESQDAKNAGKLVADGYVLERLLSEMMKPEYQNGVIVDGFPRNLIQADFVRLLHAKMKDLREEFGRPFRRPVFRVAVLWVPEGVAVQRQLSRGEEAKRLNEEREKLGLEPVAEERETDFSVEKATERYAVFKENYEVIQELQKSFHFSVIDASPSKKDVAKALVEEFRYQSSLELGSEALNLIDHIPTVSMISLHARQLLVKRLDTYSIEQPGMLSEAVFIIEKHLVPAIRRASISGNAVVRIQDKLMESNPILIDIILDVLSDRGFHAYVEQITKSVPEKIDLNTGKVSVKQVVQFRFQVEFTKSIIRQALHKTHRSSYAERKEERVK